MARGRLLTQIRHRVRILRVRRFLLWASLAVAFWALVIGQHGFIRYRMLKSREKELRQETRRLTVKVMDLEREIWRLEQDTLYIEKMARERLGFARPDERVYKITQY